MLARTKITSILSIVVLLTASVAVVLMTLFILRDSAELNTQVRVIADSSALVKQYAELNAFMNETAKDREQLEQFILHENDIISFLSEVESTGRSLGLTVQTTDLTSQDNPTSAFDTLRVSVTFTGAEQAVFTFLELMENLPYAQQIPNFSFSYNEEEPGQMSGAMQIALAIQAYE
jgi:Tfp pilus assembly protein PilO